ncbi:MAG: hypothetical protein GWO03_01775, partial [Gammaproteobacteria bacterium]|nr:hypothetical protein [Gammaproteobacteria bacterium]
LNVPVTLNLMQCTVRQVIAKVEDATGLRFLLPAGATYLDERRVRFNFYGPALDALEAARVHWELPEMVWFQLPDGRMYWGHWASGPYTKAPIPIEPKLVSQ